MSNPAARRERRGVRRPFNGDVIVCPVCANLALEFNARWRVSLKSGGFKTVPAWVCDSAHCGFFHLARREDVGLKLAEAARTGSDEVRARAQRKLMKSRAVRERATRILAKSQARRDKN